MLKHICFVFSIALLVGKVCSEDAGVILVERTDLNTDVQELQRLTNELKENLQKVKDEQTEFVSNVQSKFSELEDKVGALEDVNARQGEKLTGSAGSSSEVEDVHAKISRLHQQHADQLETMRQHHADLNSSVSSLHINVHHLSTMHNITQRLQLTADLVLQNRLPEALRHWSFAESHILHDATSNADEILSQYLRSIITLAYNNTSPGPERHTRLSSIFEFVRKLSSHEYKVRSFQTLSDHILTSDVFDGTEIFILAHYLRRAVLPHLGIHNIIPPLAKLIVSGQLIHIVHTGESYNSSHNLRLRNNGSDTLDMHTKADMIHRKKDVIKSFQYPIYASKPYTYKPYNSGSWTPIYRNTSYFLIQNSANHGYLNVPETTPEDPQPLLNCVREIGTGEEHNTEFSFVFLDGKTFGLRSASLNRNVILTNCPLPEGEGTTFCFTLDNSDEGQGERSGSRFATLSSVTPCC